jgi:hypothetical protein
MSQSLPSRRVVLALLGGLVVGACGRKAEPKPPPDADPRAPRTYPVDRTRRSDDPLPPPLPEEPPPLPPSPIIR